jgi:hypothetical protein
MGIIVSVCESVADRLADLLEDWVSIDWSFGLTSRHGSLLRKTWSEASGRWISV